METSNQHGNLERSMALLRQHQQEHLLGWWKELSASQQDQLLAEIESIDWNLVAPLIESHVRQVPETCLPVGLEPAPVARQTPKPHDVDRYRRAAQRGEALIRDGRLAAFTVAGGQASRLGANGPKGALRVTPVRGKSLFQLFAETLLAAGNEFQTSIPWYIMTGPSNHAQTVSFFEAHAHFGLVRDQVFIFPQGRMPCFARDGRILLEKKHAICFAPDGHGGALSSLVKSGALADMKRRGASVVSYFQVDNPLVRPVDPLFIGLHEESGSEMATKVAKKSDDLERVGNVCRAEGRVCVIEYSSFPQELAQARSADGSRLFDAANLAIHLLNVAFVDRIVARGNPLPFHRADRSAAALEDDGRAAELPAVKLESFIFDALGEAASPLVFEVDRREEFSPVKGATGVDSIETATRHQMERAARWLEATGVQVPRKPDGSVDARIEIAPGLATHQSQFVERFNRKLTISPGESVYLD